MTFELLEGGNVLIKAWTKGVNFEEQAKVQVRNTAQLSIVHPHVAIMSDVHLGIGATVGSVIPTLRAVIPSAVGVDLGCGVNAIRTSLTSHDLSDNCQDIFEGLSKKIPHGRTDNGGANDRGAFGDHTNDERWANSGLVDRLKKITDKHQKINGGRPSNQLGTLGGGNHFVELCLDELDSVWVMLHSGSRGIGNKIGSYFISIARAEMERLDIHLPSKDLAYLQEGTSHFDDYVEAVSWAQDYARINRECMLEDSLSVLKKLTKNFSTTTEAVNCHHNYISKEKHFGQDLYITRKGALSAKLGELGVIPGSMGTKSYIVRGKGNLDSFTSCSHGAGRVMSRTEAKKTITLEQHRADTEGVVCRKDKDVVDESPKAYKPIDDVMKAQSDLIEIVHTLKQVVNIKG